MKVKLPAAAPKNPLTTPDINAIPLGRLKLTLGLNMVLEVERYVLIQVPRHASHLYGVNNMEEGSMKNLQRAVG